jgi:hypothetical protein
MNPITLTCKECGHSNEGQRIYCHNCGVKLDRSVLPPEETLEETQEEVRKRVAKMVNPVRGFWAGSWKSAIQTFSYALLVAAIIHICRTPDEVPAPPPKGEMVEKPMIPLRLNQAMMEATPQKITIPEEMANTYLRSTLKPKTTGLVDDELKFLRVFVQFKKEGACQITSEQSIFDFSLFARVSYRLKIADNKLNAICVGGSLGRLPIHPLIMSYGDLAFQSIWDGLSREHKLIDQMQSVEVTDKEIVLQTKSRQHL